MIGILGATGAVGRTAARRIAAYGLGPLRIGGRNLTKAADLASTLPAPAHAVRVDLNDPAGLAAFCAGCRIVVSCAGPTYQVLDTVARAAFAAGADYVDIGGELAAKDALTGDGVVGDRTAVFSAGVMPGLSGLLPRLLAKGRPPRRLDVYVGGAAVFTPLSAVDALLTRGPRFGEPMAAWRDGRVAPGTLAPLHQVRLPGFPVPVHAWPYLTTEAQTLATDTGAGEVRSYNVFVSNRLPEALAAAWAEAPDARPETLAPYAETVVRASLRDNADFGAFYVMLFTARPRPGAPPGPTRVLLTAVDSYALSGVVMALATRAVLSGAVPPGVHLAAEVLDPDATAAALREDALVTGLTIE
ncbi:Putative reductoisomerase in siderophore biosynthesis gene cluster [[Actinomadura] parvosata subsp. kistnae]|uniref:Saccharopine dehydrogenase n=1 Tax=[Actinomadura] parvosata subsp. kistnae TaxID=1909395 RepID=A0A1U9ZZN2_9ACTN|nr:saccharopine dehydrogenase NADP-binding domain-containing protein [Nonomuraea sp. ATCC 55076]AQZ63380.1 saccharopine dehydrogenase [Nonomuraea sp. ATCC 55076]SPL99098.1 Putative reductoisomerase in siderophore biosynthesis gene cluster [Actinomadura parvosata subsp. kistnae]